MLFNSLEFAIFLPICFCLYWYGLKNTSLRTQNLFILFGQLPFLRILGLAFSVPDRL